MANQRKTDKTQIKNPFSSERYFHDEEGWYYYARGMDIEPFVYGSFPTKESAIYDCEQRFKL